MLFLIALLKGIQAEMVLLSLEIIDSKKNVKKEFKPYVEWNENQLCATISYATFDENVGSINRLSCKF